LRRQRLTGSRELLALATPIALTQLAQVAVTTIDLVMIGVLGVEALAAGGLAIVLFNQVRTMGVGLITAAGNRVASIAAQDEPGTLAADAERGVRDVVRASLLPATAAGLVGAVVMVGGGQALAWLGRIVRSWIERSRCSWRSRRGCCRACGSTRCVNTRSGCAGRVLWCGSPWSASGSKAATLLPPRSGLGGRALPPARGGDRRAAASHIRPRARRRP